jgi:hypothetical protein
MDGATPPHDGDRLALSREGATCCVPRGAKNRTLLSGAEGTTVVFGASGTGIGRQPKKLEPAALAVSEDGRVALRHQGRGRQLDVEKAWW